MAWLGEVLWKKIASKLWMWRGLECEGLHGSNLIADVGELPADTDRP
jgi:hypothetical protein